MEPTFGPTGNTISQNNNRTKSKENTRDICIVTQNYQLYSVFHSIIGIFAIYLSFKCNQGVNPFDLLFALCCPLLYIVYRTAVCDRFNSFNRFNRF
jgi:hypothetical protein